MNNTDFAEMSLDTPSEHQADSLTKGKPHVLADVVHFTLTMLGFVSCLAWTGFLFWLAGLIRFG